MINERCKFVSVEFLQSFEEGYKKSFEDNKQKIAEILKERYIQALSDYHLYSTSFPKRGHQTKEQLERWSFGAMREIKLLKSIADTFGIDLRK